MRLLERQTIINWYKRKAGKVSFRHPVRLKADAPLISFTFDDFPQSSLGAGGEILKSFGVVGTYFVSLGLLGADSPSGRLCTAEDVVRAWKEGHEIGCHTFSHCHSWDTESRTYESNIHQNREAFAKLIPGATFKSFSYPMSLPRPALKRICSKYFVACRAGGQKLNSETADLNQLSAFFLEKVDGDFRPIQNLIDENTRKRGWLIFATHDVSPNPSPFGCTTELFTRTLSYAVNSGARILPMIEAVATIQGSAALT